MGSKPLSSLTLIIVLLLLLLSPTAVADEIPDLRGRWFQEQVTTALAKVPVYGEVSTKTRAWLIVDVEQDGFALKTTSRICDIEIQSGFSRVRTEIPRAYLNAMDARPRPARLERHGQVWRLIQPARLEIMGARLEDPRKDPLPESADDPRVFDQDRDGSPGVTVRVRGLISGEIFLVQRAWNLLRGTLKGQDQIDGLVQWHTEQVVLGATHRLLRTSHESRPDPDPLLHYFRMSRTAPSHGCDVLEAQKGSLFPAR